MVIHSAAGAKGPEFNTPVAEDNFRSGVLRRQISMSIKNFLYIFILSKL